jgi:type II secretion system protein J
MEHVKNKPVHPAFTLVEMLVALALVSTIVTMVYGSFAAATRSLDHYHRRMAQCERASLVLRLMARQLRCAYLPSFERDPATTTGTATPQTEAFEAGAGSLCFVTTVGLGAGSNAAPALSRVRYRYDPLAETLSISCMPYVYRTGSLEETPDARPILGGVKNLEVSFYDGHQWRSGFAGGAAQTLPQAVKIALTVVDEKNRTHEFTTATPLGCHRSPPKQQVKTPVEKR